MTIQPARAALPQLLQTSANDLQKLERSHHIRGWLYRLISVVSAVALFILFSAASAIYFGLLTTPPIWQLGIACVSSWGCMKGMKLWSQGTQQLNQANGYREIVNKLQKEGADGGLKDWGIHEVQHFLVEQGIYEENADIPTELAMHDIASPLSLLPLIAKFQLLQEQARKVKQIYENNLARARNFIYPDEASLEEKHRFIAIDTLEAFSSIQLESAILLQIFSAPSTQYGVEIVSIAKNQALRPGPIQRYHVKGLCRNDELLGVIHTKERNIRILDFIAERDPLFLELSNGDTLTLEQMKNLPPKDIREQIFEQIPPLVMV